VYSLLINSISRVTVKPRIDRDSFLEKHQLKRNQEFNVEVKFIGEPPPKATWQKANKVMHKVLHVSIQHFNYIRAQPRVYFL